MAVTCAVMLGFALDALLGDPRWFPHPVCAVGKLISCMEKLLRRLFPPRKGAMIFAGAVLWIVVCGVSFAVPFLVLRFLSKINFWLGFAANSILCWLIFARKSLSEAGQHVYRAVKESVEKGRKAVAWYVGRDTAALSEEGVIKAAVETIAENLTDGVVSPLIYMLIGGAPLGMLYKAVNTLDSMVGYHNEKYENLGKFSAKMDDIFNSSRHGCQRSASSPAQACCGSTTAARCVFTAATAICTRARTPARPSLRVPGRCTSSSAATRATSGKPSEKRRSETRCAV